MEKFIVDNLKIDSGMFKNWIHFLRPFKKPFFKVFIFKVVLFFLPKWILESQAILICKGHNRWVQLHLCYV